MAKSIKDYQNEYQKARSKGDVAGMRAANTAANALRKKRGEKPKSSAVGDTQFTAGLSQKMKMNGYSGITPPQAKTAAAPQSIVRKTPGTPYQVMAKDRTGKNDREKIKNREIVRAGTNKALQEHAAPRAILGASAGFLPVNDAQRVLTNRYGENTANFVTNSTAYKGGHMGGKMAQYVALYGTGAKLTGKALSGMSAYQNAGKVGQAAARVGTLNVGVGVPLRTYENYLEGKRGKELALDTAKGVSIDAAFDGVLEAVPYAYRGIKNAVKMDGKIPSIGLNGKTKFVNDISTPSPAYNVKNRAPIHQVRVDEKTGVRTILPEGKGTFRLERPASANKSRAITADSERFMQQIDQAMNGKMDLNKKLIVGKTPDILLNYGANPRMMTMDQSDIYKIAYPTGYLGEKHGHNLGFEALRMLPQELSSPVAVLQSKTQKNSLVVFTKLLDQQNNPVMVAVHLDKGGRLGQINDVASMYGKAGFENFIKAEKEAGRVLYENKKMGLDQLPVDGLQLPGREAKLDPIFNISKNTEKVNGIKKEDPQLLNMQQGLQFTSETPFAQSSLNQNLPHTNRGVKGRETKIDLKPISDADVGSVPTAAVPGKVKKTKEQAYQSRVERNFERKMQEVLGVNKYMDNSAVKKEINVTMEKLKSGTLSDADAEKMFDTLFDQGMITSDEFFKKHKGLRDDIRKTTLKITDEEIKNIPDFGRFRNSAFGKVKMSTEVGNSIDVTYNRLMETYPELFKEVNTTAEQLESIVDVAKSIKTSEDTLSHLYAGNAEELKEFARVEFDKELNILRAEAKTISNYEHSMRGAAEAAKVKGGEISVEEAVRMSQEAKKLQREVDRLNRHILLTKEEQVSVDRMLKGEIAADQIPIGQNRSFINQMYQAKKAVNDMKEPLKELRAAARNKTRELAKNTLDEIGDLKDKSRGFWFDREMPERNMVDVAGTKHGKKLTQTYIDPVHKNEAYSTLMKNEKRNRIRGLNIGTKPVFDKNRLEVDIAGLDNKISESTLVQLLGENKIGIENIRAVGADPRKIQGAVKEMRVIYNDLIEQANQVLVKNGYEAIEYRKDYFPHFQMEKPDTVMEKIAATLGMDIRKDELPTDIAGLTHTFRPGKKWFGNALTRTGDKTTYNALQGFDMYLEGAADIIHHTDDIQRLRALENELRYKYSEQGVKDAIDEVLRSSDTEIGKQLRLDELYGQSKSEMSEFTQWIRRYTDSLAGKKSIYDRGVESMIGRDLYTASKALENRVAANMVAVNPGSWLTNFIPLTQSGELKVAEVLQGMKDTVMNHVKNDGFATRSDFLTNRMGSDAVYKTTMQRAADKASSPMRWIDQFTTEAITRAKYSREISKGASASEAMDAANKFTASVVADRSKGALPTIFEQRNPATKILTMFQVEVNNQLSYLFKDLPRNMQGEGKQKLATALAKMAIGAYIYNDVYEKITGRRSALDPLGIVNEFSGNLTGYQVKNVVDIGRDAVRGKFSVLEQQNKKGLVSATAGAAVDTVENIPFVGGLIGGGRVPVSSAIPDVWKLGKDAVGLVSGETNKRKALYDLKKEAMKPIAYMAPPFGGGQGKKMLETTEAMVRGGDFKVNARGQDQLQFAVQPTWGNAVKGSLFGKYSLPGAQRFIDEGALSDKKTDMYKQLVEMGVNNYQTEDFIRGMPKKVKEKRNYVMESPLTPDQKNKAGMYISEKKIDYSNETEFKISLYPQPTQKKLREVIATGISAEDAMSAYEKQKKYATTVGKAFALQGYEEKIQEQYGVTKQARLKTQLLQSQQISEKEYRRAHKAIKDVEGQKHPSGKTIPTTKDYKQKQIIDQLYPNYTRAQKLALYNALGISNKVW